MSEQGSSLFFPASVRRQVLEQHDTLRTLLLGALDQTTRGLRREGPGLAELSASACELHRQLHAHLRFEERALAPILWVMDLWGPERVSELLHEHARQRGEINAILEGIDGGWDVERVAITLRSLAADLLIDMASEELGCLDAAFLNQDAVQTQSQRL
jgi:hypothetical protein